MRTTFFILQAAVILACLIGLSVGDERAPGAAETASIARSAG